MASCLNKRQEPLTDVDMLLMVQKGIRPGVCGSINRYAKANQKYMKDCQTLILFKTDHSFRENQKYLNGALCCPQILSLIQFVIRGVHYFINQNKLLILEVELRDYCITLDRLAEIKFNLKCPLY